MVDVSVERLSDSIDIIPLMVSERLLDVNGDYKGMYIVVNGQFRSYNRHEERKKITLSVILSSPFLSYTLRIFSRNVILIYRISP